MRDTFCSTHPVFSFLYFCIVLGAVMFLRHPVILVLSFLGAVCSGVLLNGAKRTLRQTFLFTLPMLLIVALLNPLFNHYGVTMLFYLEQSGNWVTLEALVYGAVLGFELLIALQWFACFNTVMTTDKLVYLFGRLAPALSLILSMSLRFVPRFALEAGRIRDGQKCLGLDTGSVRGLKKLRCGLAQLSILITWALENALDTADSMKSRGFGQARRTSFSLFRWTKRDRLLMVCLLALGGVFACGCAQGACYARYEPRILIAGFTILGHRAPTACPAPLALTAYAAFGLICFLPVLLTAGEAALMRRSLSAGEKSGKKTYREIYETIAEEAEANE